VTDKNTLEDINDLYNIAEYMNDQELTKALEFIAKLILKPDIPLSVASMEIVRMQAIAAKLALQARWMTNVEKGNTAKKNLYYTTAAELDKVVASLKYLVKA
jgi:hypothetical protein